jgi:zinc transport system substrate-binding protein
MKKWKFIWVGVMVICCAFPACQKNEKQPAGKSAGGEKLIVVTTMFPLYEFARNICGPTADVSLLLPPGVEPHHFEPRPADIIKIENCDIFIYTGPSMEPWVAGLLAGMDHKRFTVIDAGEGIALMKAGADGVDPHIWLDFSKAVEMVENIKSGFIGRVPADKDLFEGNASSYKDKLNTLDRRYSAALALCRNKIIIHAGHFTFGYLAARYGLKYLSAYSGLSPNAEPTPRRLIEISRLIKQHGSPFIYYEELMTPTVADTLSKETGARLLMLHGAHNVSKAEMDRGVTFLSLMEMNLHNLREGLVCR